MHKKIHSGIILTLLLSVLFLGAWMTFDVTAQAPIVSLSAWTPTPPNIDGIIGPEEWISADIVSFTLSGGILPERTGTLYVANDAVNLYLAVAVSDTAPNMNDQCWFYFDNDHDGVFEKGDDSLRILGVQPTTMPEFWDLHWNPDVPGWTEDFFPAYGIYGTIDGSGNASSVAGANCFEFSHPLDSTDDAYDFNLSQGDTVGFALGYYDDGSSAGWFPGIPGNPEDYGDIIIASSPLPTSIDELNAKIEELGSDGEIDNQGIVASLLAKLDAAQKLIADGKIVQAKTILNAFINGVQAQSEKHITAEAADILIESAEYILSNL